jgi:putative two-component system response regulator
MPDGARDPLAPVHRHAVLIVDDYEPLRYAFASMVSAQRCDVTTAATGAAALLLLSTGYRPCLTVVDVRLPEMDGWELCRKLKADALLAPLAVVMISASPDSADGLPHPASVLLKPITPQIFREALAAHAVCAPDYR